MSNFQSLVLSGTTDLRPSLFYKLWNGPKSARKPQEKKERKLVTIESKSKTANMVKINYSRVTSKFWCSICLWKFHIFATKSYHNYFSTIPFQRINLFICIDIICKSHNHT